MANFTWHIQASATTYDLGSNTLGFFGSNYGDTITAGTFQDSIHIDTGDGVSEVCTASHPYNTKYAASEGSNKVILDGSVVTMGAGTPYTGHLPIHIEFDHTSDVATQNVYFYTYNGTTAASPAEGVEVWAFYKTQTETGATTWKEINDYSDNVGGNNASDRLELQAYSSATTHHHWYIGISASPESAGAKGNFDLGITLEYY